MALGERRRAPTVVPASRVSAPPAGESAHVTSGPPRLTSSPATSAGTAPAPDPSEHEPVARPSVAAADGATLSSPSREGGPIGSIGRGGAEGERPSRAGRAAGDAPRTPPPAPESALRRVGDLHRQVVEPEVLRGPVGHVDHADPEARVRELRPVQVRPQVSAAPPSV